MATRGSKRSNAEGSISFDRQKQRYIARLTTGVDARGRPVRRKFVGRTRTEVVKRLEDARRAMREGLPVPDDKLTVARFLDRWVDSLVGTVSEGTEVAYRNRVRLYLVPFVGSKLITKLTPADVTDMLQALEQRGLSPSTRQGARATLRRALRRAEQEGLVARNVAAVADGPRGEQRESRYLTETEGQNLLRALAEPPVQHARGRRSTSHRRLATAVLLQLALGLRPGEVLGIRWQDLDLDGTPPTLKVVRQMQRRPSGLGTIDLKTRRSRRTIVLPGFAVLALQKHRAQQRRDQLVTGPLWRDRDLVFVTDIGGPLEPRTYARFVSAICVAAGLGHRNPHALRHAAATILLGEGVPIEVVSDILGHSSIRLTKDVYGHVVLRQQDAAAEAMTRALRQ